MPDLLHHRALSLEVQPAPALRVLTRALGMAWREDLTTRDYSEMLKWMAFGSSYFDEQW